MLKKLFISTCIITLAFSSHAQKKFYEDTEAPLRFGAKAGLNINKVQGKPFSDQFGYDFLLGGFLQWNFCRKLGLQPELNFSQSSYEITDDASDIYDDLVGGGAQGKKKLDYIKIPMLVNLDVGPSQRFKLQFGPQWGKLLNKESNKSSSFFTGGDFSLLGGIWIQLPFVNCGARYEYGLTNINDVKIQNNDKWRNEGFTIFAGVTF